MRRVPTPDRSAFPGKGERRRLEPLPKDFLHIVGGSNCLAEVVRETEQGKTWDLPFP